jgi:hypothetical protein
MSDVLGAEFSFRSLEDSFLLLDRDGLRAGTQHVNKETYIRSLDADFLNTWISRGVLISWPPRSPDLSPLDTFLFTVLRAKYIT